MAVSDVRSKLARSEKTVTERCTKTIILKQTFGPYLKGSTLRCDRPANAHRLHQSGGVQF